MERLTTKQSDGMYYISQLSIDNSYANGFNCLYGKPVNKLAEFEDFMEEQGFESLEELKQKLNKSFKVQDCAEKCGCEINGVFFEYEQLMVLDAYKEFNTSYLKKYQDSQKENQKLKDMWNKLKEDMRKNYSISPIIYASDVLNKMQKLEKESQDER